MRTPRVVAIDGVAGSGKSTLARGLAGVLGLPYVNTGLMYRALAAAALREGVSSRDEEALVALTRALSFKLRHDVPSELEVEGFASSDLTTVEVESIVSAVARHPRVRELMRARQRELGEEGGAVMEGRDIGAVVFPDAPLKLFLVAELDARADRRAGERRREDGATARELLIRDARDAKTNPLEPRSGAIVIDTSDLDIDATLEEALRLVRQRAPELLA